MESMAKDVRTGCPDTLEEGFLSSSILFSHPDGVAPPTFHPDVSHPDRGSAHHSIRMSHIRNLLRRHYTRLPPLHPAAATFHPDVIFYSAAITSGYRHFPPPDVSHPEFCCRRQSTRMFHIRNSDVGWERRVFQLPRSHISGSSDSTHPETDRHFEIFCCTVLRCSPEDSRYLQPTFWDILRYFALDICCLNPQNLLVTHQL